MELLVTIFACALLALLVFWGLCVVGMFVLPPISWWLDARAEKAAAAAEAAFASKHPNVRLN